tara:strand:- start:1936 stop:2253 length:318 start_codon:yes stop_codon:yes gene_type:complete
MNLSLLNKNQLKKKLNKLMEEVACHLKSEPDIDKFLDETNLFDDWEDCLPESEYPIFIIAVLNNIKRPNILDAIINSIIENKNTKKSSSICKVTKPSYINDHPFN